MMCAPNTVVFSYSDVALKILSSANTQTAAHTGEKLENLLRTRKYARNEYGSLPPQVSTPTPNPGFSVRRVCVCARWLCLCLVCSCGVRVWFEMQQSLQPSLPRSLALSCLGVCVSQPKSPEPTRVDRHVHVCELPLSIPLGDGCDPPSLIDACPFFPSMIHTIHGKGVDASLYSRVWLNAVLSFDAFPGETAAAIAHHIEFRGLHRNTAVQQCGYCYCALNALLQAGARSAFGFED